MFSLIVLVLPTYVGSHLKIYDILLIMAVNIFLLFVMKWNSLMLIKNVIESFCALITVNLVALSSLELEVGLSYLILLVYLLQIPNLLGKIKSLV
jgi:hypothetical protein